MISKIDNDGVKFIIKEEGCKLKKYLDTLGYPTIGVGHRILPNESLVEITQDQADALLQKDIGPCEQSILKNCPNANLTQNMFDALCSWMFNCGSGALNSSRVKTAINEGRFSDVPEYLKAWDKGVDPKTKKLIDIPYLRARREREGDLFLKDSNINVTTPSDAGPLTQEEIDCIMDNVAIYLADLGRDAIDDAEAQYQKERIENV